MRYSLLKKSYIVQECLKLEEREITVNEQISIAQDKYWLKFGAPVPGRNCIYKLLSISTESLERSKT